MSQSSQIYISWDLIVPIGTPDGKNSRQDHYEGLIARYYGWNFGSRMISRARGIIEALADEYTQYPGMMFQREKDIEKLVRICDTNFDMRDIMISSDILQEIREDADETICDLFNQAASDGQLYIRMTNDGISYCFVENAQDIPLSAEDYMKTYEGFHWDQQGGIPADEVPYTKDNIETIKSLAHLMTQEEKDAFVEADYQKFLANRMMVTVEPFAKE